MRIEYDYPDIKAWRELRRIKFRHGEVIGRLILVPETPLTEAEYEALSFEEKQCFIRKERPNPVDPRALRP